jgi:tetratricopeptide (TPR) repeat protein
MRYETLLIILLLCLITISVYWQVGNHDFINFDDPQYVTENSSIQAKFSRKSILWAFTTTHAGFWFPLTWLSLLLDFQLYGLNPGGYHLTNLLLHLANTILLFLVLKRMTKARWQSAFVAALFAIHPLHVESVAWVVERKDVLSTLFWLLAMWAYLRYVERPGIARYLLTFFAFALGLMAKPMLVTLPFILLLLDYWPLMRLHPPPDVAANESSPNKTLIHGLPRRSFIELVLEKAPLFALAALSSMITFFTQRSVGAVRSIHELPFMVRFANGLVSYVKYIGKTIWPMNLAVFYPHPESTLPVWQIVVSGLLLTGISIAVMRAARNRRYLAVGWLWYLGTLVPVIGLVQVGAQAMADRFTYVPLIGLFLIIAWGTPDLLNRMRWRRIIIAFSAGVLLVALMVSTWRQLHRWSNSIMLWEHALTVTQNNYLAHNHLGTALIGRERLDEAIDHFSEALRINPDYTESRNKMGILLVKQGRLEEAATHLSRALEQFPDDAEANNNMGVLLVEQGNLDKALVYFSKALKSNPDYSLAHNNMGDALARMGKLDEAVGHLYQALQLEPDLVDAHVNLGTVFFGQARFQEAISHYRRVLQLKPDSPEVHNNLGVALAHQGKFEEAISHFTRALQLKPDYVEAQRNLEGVSQHIGSL